ALSQWRIATPRDTLSVPANQKITVQGKLNLTSGVDMWVSASNTFTMMDGATTFGIDAAYTYSVNGASLVPPALNPPTYNAKSHLYAFQFSNIPGLNWFKFTPLENSFQANHRYTTRIACLGNRIDFRILADKDADYNSGAGRIDLTMARWTAGIAI